MEYKKLGDIATYINGYPFKPEDRGENGLPIIRIQDLTGNAYDVGFYDGKYPKRIEINNGDVLISWSASLGVYVWNRGRALLNQHIFKVVFDKADVNKRYFVYAVQFKLKEMEAKTHGATMKHIIKKDFDGTLIPFPSLEEQSRIAETIDSIARVINMRQVQLKKLDDLVKARFVELFGDSEFNTMQWPTKKLSELCNIGSSKRIYQNEQCAEGIPFLRISDLNERIDDVENAPELFIPIEKYNELKETDLVPIAGDILVTSRGTLGRCYIVRQEDEFYFQDGMISWLSGLNNQITSVYLSQLFAMSGIQKQIASLQAGSTVAYLSISMLKKLNIMLPPLDRQKQFSALVGQTDKSKVAIQAALDEAQLLFDSLMQKYFG